MLTRGAKAYSSSGLVL